MYAIRSYYASSRSVSQLTTRTFANVLKASQLVLVGEAGVFYVSDMPGKGTGGYT